MVMMQVRMENVMVNISQNGRGGGDGEGSDHGESNDGDTVRDDNAGHGYDVRGYLWLLGR